MRPRRRWWKRSEAALSCREVGRVLQAYLDGELEGGEELVAAHLEDCRRCGLEEAVYRDLKASLSHGPAEVDPEAVARLERFGRELIAHGGDTTGTDPS